MDRTGVPGRDLTTLASLSAEQLRRRLEGPGLALATGAFSFRLRSDVAAVASNLTTLYGAYPLLGDDDFCDFALDLHAVGGLRRWVRPQVQIHYDGDPVFEPLPLGHAYPLLEWTLNWCITTNDFVHLVLHAAVVERNGCAAILPAPPGSGKSTLCAALVHRGWRLLSDELALISPQDGLLTGLVRPVSLKNASIDIIRAFEPSAVLGSATLDTSKGTVAHMKVPAGQVQRAAETARPAWVVFPRWVEGASPRLSPRPRADAMLELGRNAFNYETMGRAGFEALARLIDHCGCYDFSYGQLDDAIAVFDRLAAEGEPDA